MPGKEISVNKRYDAYKYLKAGYGLRETGRLLNMSAYGARYNEQRIDDTAVLTNRTYADRCILLSPAVTFIDESLQNRPTISKKQLQQQLKTKGFTLTIRQIRYRIELLGYHWKKVKKCQVIRAENQILRCELHQWFKNTEYVFDNHIFTDECTVRLGKNRIFCYVKEGHEIPVMGQLPHGDSVHIWGGISWNGPTNILIWHGGHRMNRQFYIENMIPEIEASGQRLFDGDFQVIQDSSSIHVSADSLAAFADKGIVLFPWVPQSPDFNAVEYVWRDIKEVIKQKSPKTKLELVQLILNFWTSITPSYCRILIRYASRNIGRSYDGLNREHDTPSDRVYKN